MDDLAEILAGDAQLGGRKGEEPLFRHNSYDRLVRHGTAWLRFDQGRGIALRLAGLPCWLSSALLARAPRQFASVTYSFADRRLSICCAPFGPMCPHRRTQQKRYWHADSRLDRGGDLSSSQVTGQRGGAAAK